MQGARLQSRAGTAGGLQIVFSCLYKCTRVFAFTLFIAITLALKIFSLSNSQRSFPESSDLQHKVEEKNPLDVQLQDNWGVFRPIYKKLWEHPFLVGEVELTKQLIFNLSLDWLLHWLYILLEGWLVDDYSTCSFKILSCLAPGTPKGYRNHSFVCKERLLIISSCIHALNLNSCIFE